MAKPKSFMDKMREGSTVPNGRVIWIPKGKVKLRFLGDMDSKHWGGYYESWDGNDPIRSHAEHDDSRPVALAAVVVEGRSKVQVIQLKPSVVASLVAIEEELETLTGRWFSLYRKGSGLDTEYGAIALEEDHSELPKAKGAVKRALDEVLEEASDPF